FIGKMSIASKRHIPQIVKQLTVCSRREAVEDRSQLFLLPAVDIHPYHIALFRGSLGVEPIRSRKLYDAAFQVGVSHLVMLLGRHVALHGPVTACSSVTTCELPNTPPTRWPCWVPRQC